MQQLLFSEATQAPKAINVASVPQRSPFRYPGGKTWFVPRLREWVKSQPKKPRCLVEPFVGGGIISLTAVAENLAEHVHMAELDAKVGDVWQAIIEGHSERLAQQILEFNLTPDNLTVALQSPAQDIVARAFQTILKNRTSHGGIMAAGSGKIKNGEAGKGIRSRWYPATLAKRLCAIDLYRHRITFERTDGLQLIERYKNASDYIFFIDPPYTAGGKRAGSRLYTHSKLDHEALFRSCVSLKGDFIMTYDNAEEVRQLAKRHGLQTKLIPMKNTHHAEMTELIIGRDLSWMD